MDLQLSAKFCRKVFSFQFANNYNNQQFIYCIFYIIFGLYSICRIYFYSFLFFYKFYRCHIRESLWSTAEYQKLAGLIIVYLDLFVDLQQFVILLQLPIVSVPIRSTTLVDRTEPDCYRL